MTALTLSSTVAYDSQEFLPTVAILVGIIANLRCNSVYNQVCVAPIEINETGTPILNIINECKYYINQDNSLLNKSSQEWYNGWKPLLIAIVILFHFLALDQSRDIRK